ncbi:MAG: hypothetical protein K9L28_00945 [Synergistales bacterium]|nr:hypothetical protein [Synergistales bacterium]
MQGYQAYTQGRYWHALVALDKAIERNTYLIDYYLMKALVLREIGLLEEALQALRHYREVRGNEDAPKRMVETFKQEQRFLQMLLEGRGDIETVAFTEYPLKRFLRLKLWDMVRFSGLGKVARMHRQLYFPDTHGDRVICIETAPNEKSTKRVYEVPEPVAVCPVDTDSFLLLTRDGSLYRGQSGSDGESLQPLASLSVRPSDAVLLSRHRLAIADWGGRRVVVYNMKEKRIEDIWTPEEEVFFEPVAIDASGSLLAVADRGSEQVYVVNVHSWVVERRNRIEQPRDLVWAGAGRIAVISEKNRSIAMLCAEEPAHTLVEGLKAPWSIVTGNCGQLHCFDLPGDNCWIGRPLPSGEREFLLNVVSPHLDRTADPLQAQVTAIVGFPLLEEFDRWNAQASAVWLGQEVQTTLKKVSRELSTPWRLLAPGRTPQSDKSVLYQPGAGLPGVFQRITARQGRLPDQLLVDGALRLSKEELNTLLALALHHNMRVSLWATETPDPSLARIARAAGGETYFAADTFSIPRATTTVWKATSPLPANALPPGYINASLFALYLDAGSIALRDWLPLWPAGLPQ